MTSRHLPANADLVYFTVTCHLAPIVADFSQDSDYDPNTTRIDAVVTFTPKYKTGEVIHSHTSNPPTGFLALPVTAMIDDGYLKLRSKPDLGAAPLPGTLHGLKAKIAADNNIEPLEADGRAALNYAPVRLLGNSASLEIEPEQPLFYDFSFSNIKIDNKPTNIVITGGTFEAPWEDTVIDLLDYMPLSPGPYAAPMVVGPQGPQGPPGPATIEVGSTTTSDPGSDAQVSNSGTTQDAVLDFVIPRGETGPPGASLTEVATAADLPAGQAPGTVFLTVDTGDLYRADGTKANGWQRISERVPAVGIEDSTEVGRAVVTAATASAGRQALNADYMVNAKDFGAVGDGTTDDTAALQDWLTFVVDNQRQGWLPKGTYRITSTLVARGNRFGWGITGENKWFSVIRQHTDNIPVLQVGSSAGASHSVTLEHFMLTYNTAQPSTATNANCIVFSGNDSADINAGNGKNTIYWSELKFLAFSNGFYAMSTAPGVIAPWGCTVDQNTMQTMSGGYWDASRAASGGAPSNYFGHHQLFCNTSVGPIFKSFSGGKTVVRTIEFTNCFLGPQLMQVISGSDMTIDHVSMEVGTYTAGGTRGLFEFNNPCQVKIGSIAAFAFGATNVFTPASGTLSLVRVSGAASGNSSVEIGMIRTDGTETVSGNVVALSGLADFSVRDLRLSNNWGLQVTSNDAVSDRIRVDRYINNRIVPSDLGDADYTVNPGDPNILRFTTPFTAQRTITLPVSNSNNLCNGLYYDLVFDGAINGTNTAVIKRGTTTIRTQTVDKKRLRFMWRRGTGSGAWILVSVDDLVSSDEVFEVKGHKHTVADVLGAAAVVGVPASATATGTQGSFAADANWLYVCVAPNTWRRVAVAAW